MYYNGIKTSVTRRLSFDNSPRTPAGGALVRAPIAPFLSSLNSSPEVVAEVGDATAVQDFVKNDFLLVYISHILDGTPLTVPDSDTDTEDESDVPVATKKRKV
jgi:hypothetical protein